MQSLASCRIPPRFRAQPPGSPDPSLLWLSFHASKKTSSDQIQKRPEAPRSGDATSGNLGFNSCPLPTPRLAKRSPFAAAHGDPRSQHGSSPPARSLPPARRVLLPPPTYLPGAPPPWVPHSQPILGSAEPVQQPTRNSGPKASSSAWQPANSIALSPQSCRPPLPQLLREGGRGRPKGAGAGRGLKPTSPSETRSSAGRRLGALGCAKNLESSLPFRRGRERRPERRTSPTTAFAHPLPSWIRGWFHKSSGCNLVIASPRETWPKRQDKTKGSQQYIVIPPPLANLFGTPSHPRLLNFGFPAGNMEPHGSRV